MKLSTLFLAATLLTGLNANAADPVNLITKANTGATGDKAAMAQNGWECWKCPYDYDSFDEEYTWGTPEQLTWDANGPAGNNVRWENKSSVVTYKGKPYTKNVAFTRWDNGSMHNYWYVYPVEITTPGIYTFSMLAGEWSNTSADSDNSYIKGSGETAYIEVLFANEVGPEYINWIADSEEDTAISLPGLPGDGQGKLFELPKTTNDTAELEKCSVAVTAPKAGKYYIELTGSHSIIVTSDYSLVLSKELSSTGINEVIGSASVADVKYYGIDGIELTNPAIGSLVIEKTIMTDGTVKVAKKIIR